MLQKMEVLHIVLYGCEMRSHFVNECHRLMVPRRIIGSKREEETEEGRKLHN
jgi:hypothetical protein